MSTVLNLLELIRDTQAEIARAEKALGRDRQNFSLELATDSLRARLDELEGEFAEVSARDEIDVCSYRMRAADHVRYPLITVGRAFQSFQ
jgi:hypothetical protein